MEFDSGGPRYRELINLHPDELEALVRTAPVAYWPLGLIEHHSWHLPIGFDGIKAQRLCERMAERTGGAMLPVMWWGGGGGHGNFKWTFYQDTDASRRIVDTTVRDLLRFGFRAIVLLCGHYPWEDFLGGTLAAIRREYPEALIISGTEINIAPDAGIPPGDHAAKRETEYGLALLPELVDLASLTPGRTTDSSWPDGKPQVPDPRYPGVVYDCASPLFAELGQDPRTSCAGDGRAQVELTTDRVTERILAYLG